MTDDGGMVICSRISTEAHEENEGQRPSDGVVPRSTASWREKLNWPAMPHIGLEDGSRRAEDRAPGTAGRRRRNSHWFPDFYRSTRRERRSEAELRLLKASSS